MVSSVHTMKRASAAAGVGCPASALPKTLPMPMLKGKYLHVAGDAEVMYQRQPETTSTTVELWLLLYRIPVDAPFVDGAAASDWLTNGKSAVSDVGLALSARGPTAGRRRRCRNGAVVSWRVSTSFLLSMRRICPRSVSDTVDWDMPSMLAMSAWRFEKFY